MNYNNSVLIPLVASLTFLNVGCSRGGSRQDCAFYDEWATAIKRDSVVYTPQVLDQMRALRSNQDRIKVAIKAEEAALERLKDLSELLRERGTRSELYRPATDIVRSLMESGRLAITTLKNATEDRSDKAIESAHNEQLRRLEQATLKFDAMYERECGS